MNRESRVAQFGSALLRWFLPPNRFDEIEPDLTDLRNARRAKGRRAVDLHFLLDVLSVIVRKSLRRERDGKRYHSRSISFAPDMLKYNLLVALRHFRKQKGFTFINVTGLAVGLACCLFILLYVRDELNYDRGADADRIYRVTANYFETDRHWAPIGPPVGPSLQDSYPEIADMTRFFPSESGSVLRRGDVQFEEKNGGFADSTFLSFFGLELSAGNPATALTDPGSVVISERLREKYFGDENALGRTLTMDDTWDVTVTGVLADRKENTHLPVDYLLPMATFYDGNEEWLGDARTWAGFLTYVKLNSHLARAALDVKLPAFADRFLEGVFDTPPSESMRYELQPLTDIHLRSHLEKEYRPNGDIAYIYTFSVVALIILLVACVNFINLATARATGRVREVAVRKTFGAERRQLMRQYLGESTLMALGALAFAVAIVVATLPAYNGLTGKDIGALELLQPAVLFAMLFFTLLTGLVAGVYPAVLLSGFRPARALRGRGIRSGRGWLRRTLVVFQFAVSIFLIAGSVVIWQQLDFFRSREMGFDKEHVLVVDMSSEMSEAMTENPESIKDELYRDPSVLSVSNASDLPGERYSLETMTLDSRPNGQGTQLRVAWRSDYDYAAALGLDFVAGRDFSREAPRDTSAWLLNESAIRRLGLEQPVGEILHWGEYAGPIVGVVKDFNFASLRTEIEPLVIPLRPGYGGKLLVRYSGASPSEIVNNVSATLEDLFPGSYYSYAFLDDAINALYENEETLRDVLGYFTALAILVACLGLFGLAAFMADSRLAEIGVRKVLGASTLSIAVMFVRDFLVLVGLALILAAPLTWLAAERWLSDFSFRIQLSPLVFLGAGLLAAAVAVLTVGYQATRAAHVDPVVSIRGSN